MHYTTVFIHTLLPKLSFSMAFTTCIYVYTYIKYTTISCIYAYMYI